LCPTFINNAPIKTAPAASNQLETPGISSPEDAGVCPFTVVWLGGAVVPFA
jgi:hypothetical protein